MPYPARHTHPDMQVFCATTKSGEGNYLDRVMPYSSSGSIICLLEQVFPQELDVFADPASLAERRTQWRLVKAGCQLFAISRQEGQKQASPASLRP